MNRTQKQTFDNESGSKTNDGLSSKPENISSTITKNENSQSKYTISDIDPSFKNKHNLIVEYIKSILLNSSNTTPIIKKDILTKQQGMISNKKGSKRVVSVSESHFKWYHNEDEYLLGHQLGSIPMHYIYETKRVKNASTFSVFTSKWCDKNETEMGTGEFYFSCQNDIQRDEWLNTIEFLRINAVYNVYA